MRWWVVLVTVACSSSSPSRPIAPTPTRPPPVQESPSRADLVHRDLPGFSTEVLVGTPIKESLDYENGMVLYGDAERMLSITWERLNETTSPIAKKLDVFEMILGARGTRSQIDGREGPVGMLTTQQHGVPLLASFLPCDGRAIAILSKGTDPTAVEERHRAVVKSIHCRPDPTPPTSEPGVRLSISLPEWRARSIDAHSVTLVHPRTGVVLLLKELLMATEPDLESFTRTAVSSVPGWSVTVQPAVDGWVEITGTSDGGKVEGWARIVRCSGYRVFVMPLGTDFPWPDPFVGAVENARCLKPGEKKPTWPSAN